MTKSEWIKSKKYIYKVRMNGEEFIKIKIWDGTFKTFKNDGSHIGYLIKLAVQELNEI